MVEQSLGLRRSVIVAVNEAIVLQGGLKRCQPNDIVQPTNVLISSMLLFDIKVQA